jgi:Rgg/GadR/MutR family transcriptional activator
MKEKTTTAISNIGHILKQLRVSKGLTLKEVAHTSLSVSHLSNVESGKHEITAQLLFQVLRNMNITALEFETYYEAFLRRDHPRPCDISNAYMNKNIVQLEHYLHAIETGPSALPPTKKQQFEKLKILALLSSLDATYKMDVQDTISLQDYLLNLTTWGPYDIELFGQTLRFFDDKTITILTENLLHPFQTTLKSHHPKRLLVQTLINILSFHLEKKQLDQAQKLIAYTNELVMTDCMMYEKLLLKFYQAVFSFQHGNKEALYTMQDYQFMLEECGCFQTANTLATEITAYKANQ